MTAAAAPHMLLITSADSSYPGADTVGQMHLSYTTDTSIIRVPDPVMLPEHFYLDCLRKGFDGIVVMSSGAECPFEGSYPKLAKRLDALTLRLKRRNTDPRRITRCAICTVCANSFIKEVKNMASLLEEIGPLDRQALSFDLQASGGTA